MSDIHSLMIVGSILGLGGLGLFMYKTDEDCDDVSSKKEENEKIIKNQDMEQEVEEETKSKRTKTKKSRKRGGGTRRSTFTF